MSWKSRATEETLRSTRTWFGTLTFKPEEHLLALSRARVRASKSGVDFDTMSFKDQFDYRHREMVPLVTRYLKRVRKEAGIKFRYLIVAEHHKKALANHPHYHLLVHEHGEELRHRILREQWSQHGFSNWKLCWDASSLEPVGDDEMSGLQRVGYVCKYLSKTSAARVRASRWYGPGRKSSETTSSHSEELSVKIDPKEIPF